MPNQATASKTPLSIEVRPRRRVITAAVLLVIGAGLIYLWTASTLLIETADEQSQWIGLTTTISALKQQARPSAWALATHLSPAATNALFSGMLVGMKLQPGNSIKPPLRDVMVEVKSLKTTPEAGYLNTRAELEVTSKTTKAVLMLLAEGHINFLDVESDSNLRARPRAMFGFTVDRISTKFDWRRLSFGSHAYVERLAAAGLFKYMSDRKLLKFGFPLSQMIPVPVGVDSQSTAQFKKDGTDEQIGTLTTKLTMPTTILATELSFAAPAITENGMWLLADNTGSEQALIPAVTPPGDKSELHRQVVALKAQMAALNTTYPDDGKAFSLYIRGSTFAGLVDQFSALPENLRTVTATLTPGGRLWQKESIIAVLGKAGVYLSIPKPASASFQLSSVKATWMGSTGLAFSSQVTGSATIPVAVRIDPAIGGGFTVSTSLDGKLATNVRGKLMLEPVDVAGHTLVVEDTVLDCGAIQYSVTHDVPLEFGAGWAKIPHVGANLSVPLGNKNISRAILFDDFPIKTDLGFSAGNPSTSQWIIVPSAKALNTRFSNNKVAMTEDGVLSWADVDITPAANDNPDPALDSERKALADAFAKADDERPAPQCLPRTDSSIVVGDVEIGSNSALMKFFTENWHDLTAGPGPHNEVVAALNRLGIATRNTKDELNDDRNALNNDINNTFGQTSEVAKALRGVLSLQLGTTIVPNGPIPSVPGAPPIIPNFSKPLCNLPFVCGGHHGGGKDPPNWPRPVGRQPFT